MSDQNLKKRALSLLQKNDKKKLIFILFLTLLNTIFELVGISLIIPILNYFINETNYTYLNTISFLNGLNKIELLIFILVIFNFIYFLKFINSLILIFQKNKFSWNLYAAISKNIFSIYLNKNFLVETEKKIAEKIQLIRGEANQFAFAVIMPTIDLIIEIILFVSICVFLLYFNFKISFFVITFFIVLSFFWNKYYNDYLKILGKKRQKYSIGAIEEIQNSFGNFKETIIYKLSPIFLRRFEYYNINNSNVGFKRDTITQLPRLILEIISITAILLIILFLIKQENSLQEIFILIGVFVFATVRMLPSVAKIIRSLQTIRYNNIVVDKIYSEINDNKLSEDTKIQKKNIKFENLELKQVTYSYPSNVSKNILNKLNLRVVKGGHLGIIGETGSGKSTLINILCGFININDGYINLNEVNLKDSIGEWQNIIGYVPHDVFILNESLEYNITFENEVSNKSKFAEILKKTELENFVNTLKEKEKTIIGERGGNLSRGQCQRIGLARALYKKPQILILDEATSALDLNTERKILENLYNKQSGFTIISISHRQSSLEYCKRILKIENGNLIEIRHS